MATHSLGMVAVNLHKDAPRRVDDSQVQDRGEKTGMNERGVAENDGTGQSEKRDAINAHWDEGYAIARRGSGDHGKLKAAVEQAGMEVEFIRRGNERLR